MQVSDNRRKITVGVFIFIGLVIFVIGILTLGNLKKSFVKSINVSIVFDDIQGLKAGDNVWFSGVKVGTIRKIRFFGTSQVQVFMNIEKEAQQYIHNDAMASISSDGLLGNKIIVITSGTSKFPFIENGDRLRVNPTLSTDQILNTFQKSNKNLVEITDDLKKISGRLLDGQGALGALLNDAALEMNLKAAAANLRSATLASDQTMAQLKVFAGKLNTADGLADKIITDTVFFSTLQATANRLNAAAEQTHDLARNLNQASMNLSETDNPAGFALNDEKSVEQIRQILTNLQSSSRNLDEDLKAIQSNFLFRGYFRRKQKSEEARKADEAKNQQSFGPGN